MRNFPSIVLIVIAVGIIIYLSVTGPDPTSLNPGFYSDDGGTTYFLDINTRIAPFDHHGKSAVHADVFTCDTNQTRFVGYLDRYTPETKTKLDHPPKDEADLLALMRDAAATGVEVAAPHSDQWFNRNSPEAQKIMDSIRCPHGSQNNLTLAWP